MENNNTKKKGCSNFCWLVKNLKDAIKSDFGFIYAACSQRRNVVLCITWLLAAAAAVTAFGSAAGVSHKGPGKLRELVVLDP